LNENKKKNAKKLSREKNSSLQLFFSYFFLFLFYAALSSIHLRQKKVENILTEFGLKPLNSFLYIKNETHINKAYKIGKKILIALNMKERGKKKSPSDLCVYF
jgi:hypothetical protein